MNARDGRHRSRCARGGGRDRAKGAMLATKAADETRGLRQYGGIDLARSTACPPWRSASVTTPTGSENPCADLRGRRPRWAKAANDRADQVGGTAADVEENHAIRIRVHERVHAVAARVASVSRSITSRSSRPPRPMRAGRIPLRGRATKLPSRSSGAASPRGCASCLGKRPAHRLHDRLRAR